MKRFLLLAVVALAGAAAVTAAAVVITRPDPPPPRSYAGTRAAPEFPDGLDWINTGGEPLKLSDLRGRIVLLDFWTYGCINCMHVIPDLKRLKQDYGDALVVIGVHSAKFENEGRTEAIRKVARRYGRTEPIVNDHEFTIWRAYGIRAWPTFILVDPRGNGVGKLEGEGHYETLHGVIGAMLTEFEDEMVAGPLPFDTAEPTADRAGLAFPGKVLVDAASARLFIADSNNGRIVVASLDGEVQRVIDGFEGPQGMALADADTLYVADTLASTIERVDLADGTVTRVAGDGSRDYLHDDRYDARETGLNSPWDVLWGDGVLFIAMAGQHQLWTLDPATGELAAFAGTRREMLRDGPRLEAGFNQPSGLALADGVLYVADSEASAVRAIDLENGTVTTLVGTGLFDFGDVDGTGDAVRLQHPLGVAVANGAVYVADTYNGKLKRLDPKTREVTTIAAGFDEPGGLDVAGGRAYVADTNHHAIRVVDLADGAVRELHLKSPD